RRAGPAGHDPGAGEAERLGEVEQGEGHPGQGLRGTPMTGAEIVALVEGQLGGKVQSKNAEAIDPFVVVAPGDLVEGGRFLKEEARLRFDMLNCISGVDYLETDPKKAAKAGYEPHCEVVYHFQSLVHKHRFTVKVILPRWKDGKVGELPEVPSLTGLYSSAD